MQKFKVTNKSDTGYIVVLSGSGVSEIDGLPPFAKQALKASVERYIKKYKMSPTVALGKAVGPYATVVELDAEVTVSDLL